MSITLCIQVRPTKSLLPEGDYPWAPTPAEAGPWVAYSGDHGARGRTPAEAVGELIFILAGVDTPSVEVLVEGLCATGGAA